VGGVAHNSAHKAFQILVDILTDKNSPLGNFFFFVFSLASRLLKVHVVTKYKSVHHGKITSNISAICFLTSRGRKFWRLTDLLKTEMADFYSHRRNAVFFFFHGPHERSQDEIIVSTFLEKRRQQFDAAALFLQLPCRTFLFFLAPFDSS
jgi:hypothetical protein